MTRDGGIILLNDDTNDHEEYRREHFALFGHYPPDDPGERCQHEAHSAIRRVMNDAEIIVTFDPTSILNEDSELAAMETARYERIFAETQQWQAAIEEEDAHTPKTLGSGLPDA